MLELDTAFELDDVDFLLLEDAGLALELEAFLLLEEALAEELEPDFALLEDAGFAEELDAAFALLEDAGLALLEEALTLLDDTAFALELEDAGLAEELDAGATLELDFADELDATLLLDFAELELAGVTVPDAPGSGRVAPAYNLMESRRA